MSSGEAITPEVRALIGDLRNAYKLAIVTSSGRREVEPILEAAGLLPSLDTVVYGDDVKNHKPAPDPYRLAVKRLGITRALVIEDSFAGIASARSAGLDVLELRRQCDLVREVRAQIKA
jgi:HAD superfamily hydrolase (TIGR01509 family)